ncbi:MAG: sulfatase family protein, partial [Planctomycetota bacterium]
MTIVRIILGACVWLLWVCAVGVAGDRPNVLLVVSDDQSWPHCGAYGDPVARTPVFDRLAKNGALYTHAFCPASQCGPSRAALLTGRQIWQLEEAGTHGSLFPTKFPVYTDVLEAAGYHVGYTGKPYAPGNWQVGGRKQNPAGKAYNGKRHKPPTTEMSTIDYAANFEVFLSERAEGTPFCFWFGSVEPHRDYELDAAVRAGWDTSRVVIPPYLPQNDTVRRDLLDYYQEIAWFDAQLGKMIATLERIGELDNTLIIVTSDNGLPFPRAKATLYESGTRVPFVVHWPARIPALPGVLGGRVIEDMISHIDVAPTILEAVGLEMEGVSGRSLLTTLVSERRGPVEADREFVLLGKERHNHARADN